MRHSKGKLKNKIIGTKMPGILVSIYEKAAKMVINSYYIPIAEEIIVELSQIRTLGFQMERRMLDLGTGPGYLPIEIAKRVQNIQIDAIDPLSKSIKIARRNAAMAHVEDRVHFEVGDAATLRFEDNSFDMIISTGVLHELKDPVRVLNECYRVLRSGGMLFIHDPARITAGIDEKQWISSFSFWEKIIYKLSTLFFICKPPQTYSEEEVKEIVGATNFKQYQIEEYWIKGIRELKIQLRK